MKNTNLFRLAFLLFAGLSIFLSSCQPKEEGDKKYVIGFSQCTSDSWREAVLLEMQIEASNYRNECYGQQQQTGISDSEIDFPERGCTHHFA